MKSEPELRKRSESLKYFARIIINTQDELHRSVLIYLQVK